MTPYEMGRKAYDSLQNLSDNPFNAGLSMTADHTSWSQGWKDAEIDAINLWEPAE